jgi:hypothetical protein
VQVAARKGIDNAKRLLQILSQQQQPRSSHGDEEERHSAAGIAVSMFQKVVTLLSRTGRARVKSSPQNPAIAGDDSVFFATANFAQELTRKETEREANFVVAEEPAAAAATIVKPLWPYPLSPDCHGNADVPPPSFLQRAQQIRQQQQHHLHLQQQQQKQQQQQLHVAVAPIGFIPTRSLENNSVSSSAPPLSTTTKSGFSAVSMDGSGATTNNNNNVQQTSTSLPAAGPQPQHAISHTSTKKKKKCSATENGGGKSCASAGRCHCSKRRYFSNFNYSTIRVIFSPICAVWFYLNPKNSFYRGIRDKN